MELSQDQRNIVEAPDGRYLVIAAAGSGKTRVLTERVRYLLQVRKTRSRILALTFTNKAAEEMRERLQELPDLAERTYIGTIHSFCQTIIESYGSAVGFESLPTILERESDRIAMLEEVFAANPELAQVLRESDTSRDHRKHLYRILERLSACKRDWDQYAAISSGDWGDRLESLAFREYQSHLASQRVIDFDDILLLAYRILTERPAVASIYRRTYGYLCVDEAQDLNAVQYGLVRIFGEDAKSVLLVGDPNQSIYGFNGSSAQFMCEDFPRDFAVERVELRENYRSSRAVIKAANALYPDSIDLSRAAIEGQLHIEACEDEEAEAIWVADRIGELVKAEVQPGVEGTITLERIAVLARNRYVFSPLQRALDERQIEWNLRQPRGEFLESEVGRVFDLGVRLLVNPRNRLHLHELQSRCGSFATDLRSDDPLEILEKVSTTADESWSPTLPALLKAWRMLHSDVNSFRRVLDPLKEAVAGAVGDPGSDSDGAALAIADLQLLSEVWGQYSRRVSKDARNLAQFRNQISTGEAIPNVDGKGVTLATVHAVKGLEFDIVFVMGLVEGTFPDYRAVRAGTAALAEEKNDAFVALTRSRRLLFLSWPKARFMPWDSESRVRQSKSRFLEEIEHATVTTNAARKARQVAEGATSYRPRR